jgi:two-component system, chemotaxis family, protein-glutamate methylesterase/glutaminase
MVPQAMKGELASVGSIASTAISMPRAVVIGGSAGAVDVLRVVLPALPANYAPSVVVVVHLPEHRPSLLAEIFASMCAIPVVEIDDKQPLSAGTIFFAPPGYHVLIEREETLALSNDDPVGWSRPSIDMLFVSAAEALEARAAAVLLTGASSDGAEGCARIKAAGGHVIVQEPASALATIMPQAAIDRGAFDLVLSPSAIAGYLSQWCREKTRE